MTEPFPAPQDVNSQKAEQKPRASIGEYSIKAAGMGQLVGDSALLAYGFMAGERKVGSVGLLGLGVGAIGTRYGNPSVEKQMATLHRHLGDYLKQQGVVIPKDPTTEALTKEGGLLEHIESFLYAHPSQVMNVLFSLMGVQFFRSGIENRSAALMASGTCLVGGALAGILIKEKKSDPEHPPKNTVEKAWSFIQEKPLRLTGTLFNLNLLSLGASAFEDKKNGNSNYWLKLVAVAGFAFTNIMLSLSSSSQGNASQEKQQQLLNGITETAVRVIAAQPPEMQAALLEHIAGFLSTEQGVAVKADTISALLQQKLASLPRQPVQGSWQERMDAPAEPILGRSA
jgi:hypothetical protein